MLALLGSRLGRSALELLILVLMFGGGYLYIRHSMSEIARLHGQVDALTAQTRALQAANAALAADVLRVEQAINDANRKLSAARSQAAAASQAVRDRSFSGRDPATIQSQVNRDTMDTFKRLEELTREQ